MKNRFQNLPFKCTLHRYNAVVKMRLFARVLFLEGFQTLADEVGAVQVGPIA